MNWGRSDEHQRWIDEAEAADRERARNRAELKQQEEQARTQASIDELRAEVQREIAALRAEMAQQSNLMFEAAGQALGDISNRILDRVEVSVKQIEHDLHRSFGEVQGCIDALMPGASAGSKADEGPPDLPNPLDPRPLKYKTTVN